MGLFSRKPRLEQCVFCQDPVPKEDMYEHWHKHMRMVEADVGGRAFTFECPFCGPVPECWGAGDDDNMARFRTAAAIDVHLMQRHGGMGSTFSA